MIGRNVLVLLAGWLFFFPGFCGSQPQNQHAGLLNHQIQCAIKGNDGAFRLAPNFLIAKASVPDAVAMPDGDYLYYVNGEPGKHGIYVARVTTTAIEVLGPVLIDGVFNGNAVDPDVVRLADGRIRLFFFEGWFVRRPPPPGQNRMSPIYSAISTDGRNFTLEGKVFEQTDVTDPSVVPLPDGSWLMALSAGPKGMMLAKSLDGKTFRAVPATFERGIPELVAADDGSLQLVYNAPGGLASYRSSDSGTTWTKDPTLFFQHWAPIADPSFVRDALGFRLYFKGFKNPPQPPSGSFQRKPHPPRPPRSF